MVTLQGSVGNWLQKDRAADQAWYVDGVRQIKNNLHVDWWKERGVRNGAPHPWDQALKESVRDELYQDLRVEPYDVQAEASLGDVTLRGSVPTFSQRGIAEQDARDVVGVSGVTNLFIVSPYPRSDDKIKEEIVSSIDSDALLVFQNITVTVDHGVVTLTGKVDSDYERWHAKELASRVKGVTDVINDLLITEPLKLTDESIRQQIEDHLRRDDQTRWIVDQIHVAVDSGKVTLTGAVNFWSERSEADQIACLTDGVKSVDNELQVLIK